MGVIPEKPASPQDLVLSHHGVKGMKWGVRHLETKSLQKKTARIEADTAQLKRIRSGETKGAGDKIRSAALRVDSFGSKKFKDARLDAQIKINDATHKKLMERLNTPEAERKMKGSTKAKIAVGAVVAARLLYVVGGMAINTAAVNNRNAGGGLKAIGNVASKIPYAKSKGGAFKITTL
jgi:hypothetical protein